MLLGHTSLKVVIWHKCQSCIPGLIMIEIIQATIKIHVNTNSSNDTAKVHNSVTISQQTNPISININQSSFLMLKLLLLLYLFGLSAFRFQLL